MITTTHTARCIHCRRIGDTRNMVPHGAQHCHYSCYRALRAGQPAETLSAAPTPVNSLTAAWQIAALQVRMERVLAAGAL